MGTAQRGAGVSGLLRRRARPLLGTLVEVGADGGDAALDAAFDRIGEVQAQLSRFEPGSEIARFNGLAAGESLTVGEHARSVLGASRRLAAWTGGRFDVALGSGAWALDGARLHKGSAGTRLDLGGIAKGYAVDRAIAALLGAGCSAGWVNAGGDLRVFGATALDLQLRDEHRGGLRALGRLHDGAWATSRFAATSRSALAGAGADGARAERHVSVLAPNCLWADALTKVVALDGPAAPLLREFGARAWVH
jgi:thiamine biosynthesis lipoprotein